jgi:hypothetical protein
VVRSGAAQRVDVGVGQVGDQLLVDAFGWDGQDALDDGGVLRMGQGSEPEQGVHRRQAGVAGAHTVSPIVL